MPKLPIKPAGVPVPRIRTLRDDDAPANAPKPAAATSPAASKRRARRPKFVF
jgi:hypothetical protein